MKVNVELYKRMILWLAEHNNVPTDDLDILNLTWKELHFERKKVEETGLTYEMMERNYWEAIRECEEVVEEEE